MNISGVKIPDVLYSKSGKKYDTQQIINLRVRELVHENQVLASSHLVRTLYCYAQAAHSITDTDDYWAYRSMMVSRPWIWFLIYEYVIRSGSRYFDREGAAINPGIEGKKLPHALKELESAGFLDKIHGGLYCVTDNFLLIIRMIIDKYIEVEKQYYEKLEQ